jgi:gluconate 2-dehydrogenase gamma chain
MVDHGGARERRHVHSRRAFLTGAGAAGAAAAAGLAATRDRSTSAGLPSDTEAHEFAPLPPSRAPLVCSINEFFTQGEALAVTALSARIVPGNPDDPGAREACAAGYIDHKLASFESFATPTYHLGPFPYLADELGLDDEQAKRYGTQSDLTPQDAYRRGLAALAAHCASRFGATFDQLAESDQDEVLAGIEAGSVDGFETPSAEDFFDMVRSDVIEGMFADPAYGGNAGLVGWQLIGYPGAQRGYTPDEVRSGTAVRHPQGLSDMSPVHPGHSGGEQVVQLPFPGSARR